MADAPPPYNPGYANEKLQMAPGGPEVPGTQPPPQHYPQPQQPPQHYPQPAGGQQPYPQPAGGQQPYPQPAGGQQPYPQPVAGQQPYQPPPGNPQYPADQKGYPPPGHYPPPGAQPYPGQPPVTGGSHTVIIQQPQVVGAVRYGPSPVTITCPTCSKLVTTGTQSQCCSSFPWLICGIICLVGLVTGGITWLGCCLIPFCIPDLYDVNHSCPNCNSQVGHFSKMS